jgi:hypothetical protein
VTNHWRELLELRVAGQTPLHPGHADQDEAEGGTVVEIPEGLESRCLQPIGLVDDQNLDVGESEGGPAPPLGSVPFLDGFVQGSARSQDLLVELGRWDDHGWCPNHRARGIQPGWSDRARVPFEAPLPALAVGMDAVPVSVVAR